MDQGKQLLNYALKTCGPSCQVEPVFEQRGDSEADFRFIVVKLKVTRYFRQFAPTVQEYHFNSNGRLFVMDQTNYDKNGNSTVNAHHDLTLFEAKGLILSIS